MWKNLETNTNVFSIERGWSLTDLWLIQCRAQKWMMQMWLIFARKGHKHSANVCVRMCTQLCANENIWECVPSEGFDVFHIPTKTKRLWYIVVQLSSIKIQGIVRWVTGKIWDYEDGNDDVEIFLNLFEFLLNELLYLFRCAKWRDKQEMRTLHGRSHSPGSCPRTVAYPLFWYRHSSRPFFIDID